MGFKEYVFGDKTADTLLVQMVDDHDLEFIEKEVFFIRELSGGKGFCLKAFRVNSWNRDLSPWPAPAVFGSEGFGGGAAETLDCLLKAIPELNDSAWRRETGSGRDRKVFIGGYSLAGLFALWAGYNTDRFAGIAAASPSIWFPGFTDYMRKSTLHTQAVCFSLGDREEKTKNPVMARVGDAIREGYSLVRTAGTDCILEWNPGNHFREPDLRTAKAFAWLMNRDCP